MKRSLLVFLLIAAPSLVRAEELTWEQFVTAAVQNNPDLRAAQAAIDSSKARYNGSLNGIYPQLNLQNRYTRSNGDLPDARWTASGTASINVFNMSVYSQIDAASATLARSQAALNERASTVLFNLRQAFANLLFAQQQTVVNAGIRDIRERNARMVTLRYDSGRESKGNMMRAKAELLESEQGLTQAGRTLRTAQQALGEQLGRDKFDIVSATGSLAIAKPPEVVPANIAELAEGQPSVTIAKANLYTADADIARARSGLWPTLSAAYTRSFLGASEFPGNPGWTASGVLSYPIFGGGPTAVYNDLKASRRAVDASMESLRSARNAARTELESAYAALAAAGENIALQAAFLAAARQRNAEADIRYSNGLMTYDDWELIVTDRVTFEQGLIRAQRDAVVAEAGWDKASGKVLNK